MPSHPCPNQKLTSTRVAVLYVRLLLEYSSSQALLGIHTNPSALPLIRLPPPCRIPCSGMDSSGCGASAASPWLEGSCFTVRCALWCSCAVRLWHVRMELAAPDDQRMLSSAASSTCTGGGGRCEEALSRVPARHKVGAFFCCPAALAQHSTPLWCSLNAIYFAM
jgi:hypothetical protein